MTFHFPAIAERLAQEGAKVVICSRKKENVEVATAKLKAKGLAVEGKVCHVGNAQQRRELVEWTLRMHGRIDILVNNAAINPVFGEKL
jgi:dehydrogenase/reductase SDR family protein 4